MVKDDLKTAPVESHACTTAKCVPVESVSEVFSELALMLNLETLSM
jgi:putative effector of murein hydrolase